MLWQLFRKLRKRHEVRRTIRILQRFDNRILGDIGAERDALKEFVRERADEL